MLHRSWGRVVVASVVLGTVIAGGSGAGSASAAARRWEITPTPHVAESYALAGVSCSTATSCVAVGSIAVNTTFHSLIETWDGSNWTVTPSPVASPLMYFLSGVSCVDPSNCVAVGQLLTSAIPQTLVETWDGANWTVTPSPSTGDGGSTLSNVSCASTTDCVAVGSYAEGGNSHALIEMWNGVDWSIAASPQPRHTPTSGLSGVSCPSATRCIAVGTGLSDLGNQPLVEKWNGTKWSLETIADPGSTNNGLAGVSCSNGNQCVAVGYSGALNGPLIEMWDGTNWSIASRPNPGTGGNSLVGVSCPGRMRCVATGSYNSERRKHDAQTLVEAWNGTTWSVVPSASHFRQIDSLQGVSCSSSASCTAVGYTIVPPNSDLNAFVLTGRP
jgi:hypothetical protein